MDKKTFYDLAIARIYRSGELLEEARDLLKRDRYKSANNRAFYSVEKAMKALLATVEIESDTHNGVLMQFNVHFIKEEIASFEKGDYKKIASIERIRNNSDYDDFYIADKEECRQVVETASMFYMRAIDYMESKNLLGDNYDELKGMIEIEK